MTGDRDTVHFRVRGEPPLLAMAVVFRGLLVATVFFGAAFFLRYSVVDEFARERREVRFEEDFLKSPGKNVLSLASMGHALGWADVFWLGVVQELASPTTGKEGETAFDRIQRWTHIAVDLDPRYFTVYHSAAVHLTAYGRRADASDEIIYKGQKHIPRRWEFPFLLGYNDYFIRADGQSAAEHWEEAIHKPASPPFLPSLVARAKVHGGSPTAEAVAILEELLEFLPDGPQREDAVIRLKILKSEPRLALFDALCERHRVETGILPPDGQTLVQKGYTTEPAEDLLGAEIKFYLGEEQDGHRPCVARTQYILQREHEALKDNLGKESPAAVEARRKRDLELFKKREAELEIKVLDGSESKKESEQ